MSQEDVTSADDLVPDVFDRLAGNAVEPGDWVTWGGVWTGKVKSVDGSRCIVRLADFKQSACVWMVTPSSVQVDISFASIDAIIKPTDARSVLPVGEAV